MNDLSHVLRRLVLKYALALRKSSVPSSAPQPSCFLVILRPEVTRRHRLAHAAREHRRWSTLSSTYPQKYVSIVLLSCFSSLSCFSCFPLLKFRPCSLPPLLPSLALPGRLAFTYCLFRLFVPHLRTSYRFDVFCYIALNYAEHFVLLLT